MGSSRSQNEEDDEDVKEGHFCTFYEEMATRCCEAVREAAQKYECPKVNVQYEKLMTPQTMLEYRKKIGEALGKAAGAQRNSQGLANLTRKEGMKKFQTELGPLDRRFNDLAVLAKIFTDILFQRYKERYVVNTPSSFQTSLVTYDLPTHLSLSSADRKRVRKEESVHT